MITGPCCLRTGIQSLPSRGHADVLNKHSVIQPAHPSHITIDGKDHADRCVEELEIPRVKLAGFFVLAFADAEQTIHIPADLAAPCQIGIAVLFEIMEPTGLVFLGLVPERVEHCIAQRCQGIIRQNVNVPRLHIGAARRARSDFEDMSHRIVRHWVGFKRSHRPARRNGFIDAQHAPLQSYFVQTGKVRVELSLRRARTRRHTCK